MLDSQRLGIRFDLDARADEEGADGKFFSNSLELLAAHFDGTGERFFFDTVDIDQRTIGGQPCQDLFGWIVPSEAEDAFVPRWRSGEGPDELADLDAAGVEYVGVTWSPGEDGSPEPAFDRG